MDNIVEFNRSEPEAKQEPNFHYTLTVKDEQVPGGVTTIEDTGYAVVNQLFVAICRGDDGVIHTLVPFEDVKRLKNNGPVNAGASTLN